MQVLKYRQNALEVSFFSCIHSHCDSLFRYIKTDNKTFSNSKCPDVRVLIPLKRQKQICSPYSWTQNAACPNTNLCQNPGHTVTQKACLSLKWWDENHPFHCAGLSLHFHFHILPQSFQLPLQYSLPLPQLIQSRRCLELPSCHCQARFSGVEPVRWLCGLWILQTWQKAS